MRAQRGNLISKPRQIRLLASGVRQEIVDTVQAMGPCSVKELGEALGRPADSLYHHVRLLLRGELLIRTAVRPTRRREESLYDVPGCDLRLEYDPANSKKVQLVNKVVASMLRIAERDFRAGFSPAFAVTHGAHRNLWASRGKAWLSKTDLAEVNRLLRRLAQILDQRKPSSDRRLMTLTWVLSPTPTQSRSR